MCLLVILNHVVPEYPLIVAANRDEDPARGGESPGRWPDGIVAPRDPAAGGTWIGVNGHGVFSAVTNRAGSPPPGPEIKSRGILPLEALKEKSAFLAHRRAERIPTFVFRAFNWVYGDAENVFVREHGGPSDLSVRLRPGLHLLTNVHDLNQADREPVVKLLSVSEMPADLDTLTPRLKELLGQHEPLLSETHRICKHDGLPQTLSSSVVALHATDRKRDRWWYHEGAPCKNRWQDVTELLI